MITPDTKDWTWVLREPCSECGLAAADVEPTTVGERVRATLPRWEEALGREDARERPDADTWSPTEYACHVRDVFRLFAARTALMLEQDDPQFENWDQDETAVADHYETQDPFDVAPQLAEAGERVADVFDAVPADAWSRTGRRSDGSTFTVATLAQYFLHDVEHHLHDVVAQPRRPRPGTPAGA